MGDFNTKKKTTIGGQALIEGVMMRGPEEIAIAVRKPDSQIIIDKRKANSISKKYKILGLPFIRGSVALVESLMVGINALTFSAKFFEDDETVEGPGKFEKFLIKIFGEKLEGAIMGFSVFLSLLMTVGLFFILPSVISTLLNKAVTNGILKNFIEGIIRIAIFAIYILAISNMKDIRRVFEYHGAEHKSIFCYENQEELTVENCRKYSTLHPRCGTNFLFIVMLVSIFVFSFLGWPGLWMRILSRIIFIPIIAGISFELLKFVGRSDSKLVRILIYPGLLLQKLTTREPDDSQLEVAIAALKEVLVENKEADVW
ncbi:hypothetical protein OXPF_16920 [Oxobacter pfennigii]|uniref:DUF1385 domain-containing protein n=1 Tax=Oxobacter pfennigii TaxID=36849 RepID=A0A0P8YXX0_9CLOT|nr:DUF1385 domain-containing protein [Oxobacter pfennigii]KPU44609.1 hypothetical protein OXPF_16920 [Oxobacter pfennigii]